MSSTLIFPPKRPDDILDYEIDWTRRIEPGDTITATRVTVTGATLGSFATTAGVTKFWVSGGTLGSAAIATIEIDTAGGRTYDNEQPIRIR